MKNIFISSREYKLMFNAGKFSGDRQQLLVSAGQFWNNFRTHCMDRNIDT